MRLEQLYYIVEVDKQKSISKAAKQLYISQPSLSSAISNLEDELNTKIFIRSQNGVEATEAGRIVVEKASRIVQEAEEIKNMFTEQTVKGNINVTTMPAICNFIILEVFSSFKEEYPHINIHIREEDNTNILRELDSGDTDIGIIGLCDYEKKDFLVKARKNNIYYEDLFLDELCFYAGPNNPLSYKHQVSIEEIYNYPLVIYKNNVSDKDLEEFGNTKHLNILRFNDRESIKRMASQGNGLALLPRVMSLNDIYVLSGKLVPLDIANLKIPLSIGIVYKKSYLPVIQKEFILYLKNIIANIIK
ncbi:transcriptional regulator, LysR family [Desulforamulus reducens MI-1]|uniref:Transcriptional regulator, LysR family n=1 Tax=Desulforamulus reducens (strain ATCC BAA-1160 / DSM 100696 / MI-1) TaxID=349161 RepID=A4J7X6_DESRM|nr:LysR family transcriptional regulator [Desulforamulus reducens]ABO51179.1 transcriptional regulator, LysR family [Desulforamulus reducens MI-1]